MSKTTDDDMKDARTTAPAELLQQFDDEVVNGQYRSRAEAIRDLMRQAVRNAQKDN